MLSSSRLRLLSSLRIPTVGSHATPYRPPRLSAPESYCEIPRQFRVSNQTDHMRLSQAVIAEIRNGPCVLVGVGTHAVSTAIKALARVGFRNSLLVLDIVGPPKSKEVLDDNENARDEVWIKADQFPASSPSSGGPDSAWVPDIKLVVSSKTSPGKLAGAISGHLEKGANAVELQGVGRGASMRAADGIAFSAAQLVATHGPEVRLVAKATYRSIDAPSDVTRSGTTLSTAIVFTVKAIGWQK